MLQEFVEQHGQTARTRSICRSLFVAVLVGITVCVPVSLRTSTFISRTMSNATVTETMKVVKLNKYEYIHSIQLHYVIIPKIQKGNDNDDNGSLLYAHSESS